MRSTRCLLVIQVEIKTKGFGGSGSQQRVQSQRSKVEGGEQVGKKGETEALRVREERMVRKKGREGAEEGEGEGEL